ncbi:hypothetical protein NJ7G_0095 [Natrinema sp. J7-2]|nr:hypothetical protein NJ7G_0095 [Natrinema sp. J7-2]
MTPSTQHHSYRFGHAVARISRSTGTALPRHNSVERTVRPAPASGE